MKKVVDFIADPLKVLGAGGIFFFIGLINGLSVHASSMQDLSWWAKGAVIGFCICASFLFIKYLVFPIVYKIGKLLKIVK